MRLLSLSSRRDLDRELARVGVDSCSHDIFAAKNEALAIRLDDLSIAAANILKQTALALGADCAVHRWAVSGRVRRSNAVLFVTRRQLGSLVERLGRQPECVARLVPGLVELDHRTRSPGLGIRLGRRRVDLGARTFVMGILNLTPDSFYDGGRYEDPGAATARAEELAAEGADFIDVGAESTRPGSDPVRPRDQLQRLAPVLKRLRRLKVPVSVDTTSARVAEAALDQGAAIVNDTSALRGDRRMPGVLARRCAPVVVMHMQGTPKTMQQAPSYDDLMAEVTAFLAAALERGERAGIDRSQMIIDPGIGFGKRIEDNLELLRRLGELHSLGRPILVGPSRKAFIGKLLDQGPEDRLEGTLAACVTAAQNGASILRVHDVRAAKRALAVADAIGGG